MNKIILAAFLFSSVYGLAQKDPGYYEAYQKVKRSSVGFNIGPTAFHGDADQIKPGFFGGIFYKYSASPAVGIKFSGNFGLLQGTRDKTKPSISFFGNTSDSKDKGDSYQFKNTFWDLDATVNLISGNQSLVRKPKPLHFYLFIGIGIMGNNSKGSWKDPKDVDNVANLGKVLDKDTVLKFKGVNSKVPLGIGFTRRLTDNLDLGLEYKFNYTQKDLIDAYNFSGFKNKTFDSYSNIGINLTYKLRKTGEGTHMDWISPTSAMLEDKSTEVSDSDGDGVADKFDTEPGTPKGAQVYGNGVAVDADQDGVPDYRDDELLSYCNKVDVKGVAIDTDADGITDCRDEEMETPTGSLVDKTGRKVDVSSTTSNSGGGACCDCNDVTLPSVFVDEDNEFRPEAYSALYLIGTKLQQCPDVSLDIVGYYGMNKSSEQGARSKTNLIIEYLVNNFGISRTKFNVQTKPETMGGKYSKQRIDIKSKK